MLSKSLIKFSVDGWSCGPSLLFTNGTFHAKMGTIKDRNGMDLTEAKDIKKRWQEYTEELYKKYLHDPDNHDHSPRARHPGVQSQVGLRKHRYKQS